MQSYIQVVSFKIYTYRCCCENIESVYTTKFTLSRGKHTYFPNIANDSLLKPKNYNLTVRTWQIQGVVEMYTISCRLYHKHARRSERFLTSVATPQQAAKLLYRRGIYRRRRLLNNTRAFVPVYIGKNKHGIVLLTGNSTDDDIQIKTYVIYVSVLRSSPFGSGKWTIVGKLNNIDTCSSNIQESKQ